MLLALLPQWFIFPKVCNSIIITRARFVQPRPDVKPRIVQFVHLSGTRMNECFQNSNRKTYKKECILECILKIYVSKRGLRRGIVGEPLWILHWPLGFHRPWGLITTSSSRFKIMSNIMIHHEVDSVSHSIKLTPLLMEPGDSMPHSQGLVSNPYPESNQPNSSFWYPFL